MDVARVVLQATGSDSNRETVSVRGNFTANRLTTAATWATDRAEVLFNLEYDDPLLLDDGGGVSDGLAGLDNGLLPATAPNADGSDLSKDGEYTIYWNVAEDEPMPNLKTINVIITYTGMGAAKTVTLTHRKSKFMYPLEHEAPRDNNQQRRRVRAGNGLDDPAES